jgi:hypothetical protein
MASVSDYRIEIQALSKADGGRFVGICPVACLRARRRKVLLRICAMPSPNGSNRRGRQVAPCHDLWKPETDLPNCSGVSCRADFPSEESTLTHH